MDLTREWGNKETETFIKVTFVNSLGEFPAERAGREEEIGKNELLSQGRQNLLEESVWFYCQFYKNKMKNTQNFHANISGICKMHKYSSGNKHTYAHFSHKSF